MLRGFYDVVPLRALTAAGFDAGELELALCGVAEIDVRGWREHACYSGVWGTCASTAREHPVAHDFWSCVEALPQAPGLRALELGGNPHIAASTLASVAATMRARWVAPEDANVARSTSTGLFLRDEL